MTIYKNLSGKSSVLEYWTTFTSIIIKFKANRWGKWGIKAAEYNYTNSSAGGQNIVIMKDLAVQGRGLNTFINKHQPIYATARYIR
jgi:hypothetical protein